MDLPVKFGNKQLAMNAPIVFLHQIVSITLIPKRMNVETKKYQYWQKQKHP